VTASSDGNQPVQRIVRSKREEWLRRRGAHARVDVVNNAGGTGQYELRPMIANAASLATAAQRNHGNHFLNTARSFSRPFGSPGIYEQMQPTDYSRENGRVLLTSFWYNGLGYDRSEQCHHHFLG
jgi:hypothetical protein